MLHIKRFIFNPIGVNTYVVSDDAGSCGIIDCGCWTEDEWSELQRYLSEHHLRPTLLLNTHFHLDHVFGNQFVLRDYGLKPRGSAADYPIYDNVYSQVEMFFGSRLAQSLDLSYTRERGPALNDGDKIQIGDESLEALLTPGHSPGGLCFYSESNKTLFSGDTLFRCSIGRTDLPGGNYGNLIHSIQTKLFVLPADTVVLPGHNEATTIQDEIAYNPYVRIF